VTRAIPVLAYKATLALPVAKATQGRLGILGQPDHRGTREPLVTRETRGPPVTLGQARKVIQVQPVHRVIPEPKAILGQVSRAIPARQVVRATRERKETQEQARKATPALVETRATPALREIQEREHKAILE